MARELKHDLGAVPAVIGGATTLTRKGFRDPIGSARGVVRYVDSARRVLSPPNVPGLPALSARGGSWQFVALDLDFDDLRAAAKTGGGSVNDAYLAALLAAFRLYHAELGAPLDSDATMPVSVPVSVRRDDDSAGGNRFAPARLVAPVGIADPVARIERVRQLVRGARSEPALESADVVAPLMARLPASLLVRVAGSATAGNDLQASNVPGVEEDLYLAGALIERIYPFAPLPGCAAMITLHTYRGQCSVGANLDAAAVVDPALFAQCLSDGFAEVLALAPDAGQAESADMTAAGPGTAGSPIVLLHGATSSARVWDPLLPDAQPEISRLCADAGRPSRRSTIAGRPRGSGGEDRRCHVSSTRRGSDRHRAHRRKLARWLGRTRTRPTRTGAISAGVVAGRCMADPHGISAGCCSSFEPAPRSGA